MDDLPAYRYGHIHGARAVLVGATMRVSAGVARKVVVLEGRYVANGPVHDETHAASLLQVSLHDLAHARIGQLAAGIHDQYMAGLDQRHGLVDEEVVTRPRLDGERGSHPFASPVVTRQAHHATLPMQVVAEVRGNDGLPVGGQFGAQRRWGGIDLE